MTSALGIDELTPDAIGDAVAYWLYAEDEAWERWQLVPGSPRISPNGRVLRLAFELEGDRFELALVQREEGLRVKFDEREHPEQELPVRAFRSSDEALLTFVDGAETVFLELTLDV